MTQEEIKALSDKVANSQASPSEKLSLMKELNSIVSAMREDITKLKDSKKLKEAREKISNL